MAVKIKLQRLGKIRQPYYRIIVADSRTRRSGKAIETIGKYHPKQEPSYIEVNSERAQYWLGVGAQPTEPVQRILERTGDWQRFKGEPVPENSLKVAEPGKSKQELFNEALAAAGEEPTAEATTPKKKGSDKRPAEAKTDKSEKSGEKTEKADTAEASRTSEAASTETTEAGDQAAATDAAAQSGDAAEAQA